MGIQTEPTLNWHDPVALFEVPWMRSWSATIVNYDVTPDGQRFVFVTEEEEEEEESEDQSRKINVVLNWFEELNRLVPIP